MSATIHADEVTMIGQERNELGEVCAASHPTMEK